MDYLLLFLCSIGFATYGYDFETRRPLLDFDAKGRVPENDFVHPLAATEPDWLAIRHLRHSVEGRDQLLPDLDVVSREDGRGRGGHGGGEGRG